MADDDFYSRLHEAEEAGLNQEWALKVAYKEITLDEALGGMDMDDESVMSDIPDDDYDCGCRGENACEDCVPF